MLFRTAGRDNGATRLRVAACALAIVLLLAGSAIVAVQRILVGRYIYISELGAQGMESASAFRVGFALLALGIVMVAVVIVDVRARGRVLRWWRPALSLAVAGVSFALAAAVNCSAGCPAWGHPDATERDVIHVSAAVLGFAAGCWAMWQCAHVGERPLRLASIMLGVAVASIAASGGIISLAEGNTDIGSTLEYIAAALGVAWLCTIALVHTRRTLDVDHPANAELVDQHAEL